MYYGMIVKCGFIRLTENNRRKNMHDEPYRKKTVMEQDHDHVPGWDKCHIPAKDIFRHNDKPENCPSCGGIGTKRSEKMNIELQYLACNDCGICFVRPVVNGIVMTCAEVEI
jgi:hypothetical protein